MFENPAANTVMRPDAVHTANIMPIQSRQEFKQLREPSTSRPRTPEVKILKRKVSEVAYCDKFALPRWSSVRRASDLSLVHGDQLKVLFQGISTMIWRRLLVHSDSTISRLTLHSVS